MGVPSPFVPRACSEKTNPSAALALSSSPLVLGVDDAPRHDPAVLVGEEEGHPRVREVGLPLVQDPAGGAQDGAVRVDLPEDVGPGRGIDVVRDRAPPALLDLLGHQGRGNGSPDEALRDQPLAGAPYLVLAA